MKKDRLLPAARSLYSQGHSPAEIAEALDVSAGTVRRWRREDSEDWEELQRQQRPREIQELMRGLEQQIDQMVRDDSLDAMTKADAIAKLERSLDSLCSRFESVDLKMEVAREMAEWARQLMGQNEVKVVRRLVAGYTAALRAEYK